jgi:hypothetical protein
MALKRGLFRSDSVVRTFEDSSIKIFVDEEKGAEDSKILL